MTDKTKQPTRRLRIRRCQGNRSAWCLVRVNADGVEADSFGSYTTSYSLDALIAHAGHLAPRAGDKVELIP